MSFKHILFMLCTLAGLTCFAVDSVTLDFNRPGVKGERYDCSIVAELSKLTMLTGPDGNSKRHRTVLVKLDGEMLITGVSANGQTDKLEFTVTGFDGEYNGERIKSSRNGQTIEVDFSKGDTPLFSVKGEKYVPLTEPEKRLLEMIFQKSPDEGMAALLGKARSLKTGDKWVPPVKMFAGLFSKHGIKFSPEQIKAVASLEGENKFKGINCWVIRETLRTVDIADFQFNFNMKILLPVDPGNGGAVRIERQAVWKTSAGLPANDPLTIGRRISTQVVNSVNVTSIPLNSLKDIKRLPK